MKGFGSILSEHNFDKLDKLQKYVQDHGHNVEELAIAWLLAHPYVTLPVLLNLHMYLHMFQRLNGNFRQKNWLR